MEEYPHVHASESVGIQGNGQHPYDRVGMCITQHNSEQVIMVQKDWQLHWESPSQLGQ
jgi:hypothetical protein